MAERQHFLGIPIMTEQEMTKAATELAEDEVMLYVCIRVADSHPEDGTPAIRARRRRTPCEHCGEICYIDPKGYDPTIGKAKIVCLPCMVIITKQQKTQK